MVVCWPWICLLLGDFSWDFIGMLRDHQRCLGIISDGFLGILGDFIFLNSCRDS